MPPIVIWWGGKICQGQIREGRRKEWKITKWGNNISLLYSVNPFDQYSQSVILRKKVFFSRHFWKQIQTQPSQLFIGITFLDITKRRSKSRKLLKWEPRNVIRVNFISRLLWLYFLSSIYYRLLGKNRWLLVSVR